MKISLQKVHDLYPNGKVICVEEYFSNNQNWTAILPDGTDVRDPDLYYKFGLNFVVAMCIQNGATQISFKLLDENKEYSFPDFYTTELNEK